MLTGEQMEERFVSLYNRILKDDDQARQLLQRKRQRQIAREYQENRKAIDGLGAPVMEVDPETYHLWARRFKDRDMKAGIFHTTGYECWKDKQWVREFLRDNPDVRVKATGTKTQFGYTAATKPRFHKVYPCEPAITKMS